MGRRGRSGASAALLAGLAAAGLACDPTPADAPPADAPQALVLITVDTLRADRLAAYGGRLGLTPRLDDFAAENLVFEAAYAPTPFTMPSLVSLLTGRHPLELGLRINTSQVGEDARTLAEVLGEHGWKTAAVVSNVVLAGRSDVAQGFEIYDDSMPQREAVRRWPERIAAGTTDAALRVVDVWRGDEKVSDRPLFLWVHYQDPHGPYTPPEGYRERFLAEERGRDARRLPEARGPHGLGGIPRYQRIDDRDEAAFYRAGYDGEVAYLDGEIGRLLDALAERGLDDRVVFTADHGESLGEDDYWFSHSNDLTDPLLHVPLVLRLPGAGSGRRSDVVRLSDLHTTLLSAVLASPPAPDGDTRDLLAPGAERESSIPLLTTLEANPERRIGIVADGYKLILTLRDGVWSSRLHPLGDESVDLAAPAPQVAARLREQLWSLYERRRSETEAPLLPLSEESRRNLEALGYVDAPAADSDEAPTPE